jgi:hypothetical protein
MKQTLTVSALAVAVLLPASPAQAAPPKDPASAVAAQFKKNRGVKFAESHRTHIDGDLFNQGTRRGVIQLSPTGTIGYDSRTTTIIGSVRILAIGPYSYMSGKLAAVPKGQTWNKVPSKVKGRVPFFTKIDLTDPAVVRALLQTAKVKKKGFHQGTITLDTLRQAGAPNVQGDIPVAWKLWTDAKHLPIRLNTKWTESGIVGERQMTSDLRFTGWGSKVALRPPAKL